MIRLYLYIQYWIHVKRSNHPLEPGFAGPRKEEFDLFQPKHRKFSGKMSIEFLAPLKILFGGNSVDQPVFPPFTPLKRFRDGGAWNGLYGSMARILLRGGWVVRIRPGVQLPETGISGPALFVYFAPQPGNPILQAFPGAAGDAEDLQGRIDGPRSFFH